LSIGNEHFQQIIFFFSSVFQARGAVFVVAALPPSQAETKKADEESLIGLWVNLLLR